MMALLDHIPGWAERRPTYSTLPTTPTTATDISPIQHDESTHDRSDAARATSSLSRFFADFTLGFADGLTVPFALTAGLSSLGQTNTVIYAGMAEICAGCISMGIGGYLAAKGEQRPDTANNNLGFEHDGRDEEEEKSTAPTSTRSNQAVGDYLAPLQLPTDLLRAVMAHVDSSPEIVARVRDSPDLARSPPTPDLVRTRPLISGLSVALGYLLGGLLPLAPYFFVKSVTDGLLWSFCVCIIALFIFGFTKEYILHVSSMANEWNSRSTTRRIIHWDSLKRGLCEGVRMVVFGGIAAIAAVLCVKLFEGLVS
ncbi:Ccc1 family [Xylaria palmicola]|nr:Ccc1 family [Xylaria palmicola]